MANWTQEDYNRHSAKLAELGLGTTTTREGRRVGIDGNAGHDSAGTEREIPTAARLGQKAKGTIRKPRSQNKTEAAYAAHLEMEKRIGDVLWYEYEPWTFKVGLDCRYTPDFGVMKADGSLECHEVKARGGNGKARYEDDARVKIAAAAKQHPIRFLMVWPATNGEWDSKEF